MRRASALVLLCASLCAAAPQDRVLETIENMDRAIAARDPGAYLLGVDPTNHTFLREQRAWINDAIGRDVQDLRVRASGDARVVEGPAVEIELEYAWSYGGHDRTESVPMRFVPVGSESGAWVCAGIAWETRLVSDDGSVIIDAHEQNTPHAQHLLERVPEILGGIESELGTHAQRPLVIKLFEHMDQLQFSISPAYTEPLSGWNEPHESIKLLVAPSRAPETLTALVAHEIGHAVSFGYGASITDAPWWALEGIAEAVSDPYRGTDTNDRQRLVATLVTKGEGRTWDQLADFRGEAMSHIRHVYTQGWSMLKTIETEFGRSKRNEWLRAMGQGKTLEQATQSTLGIGFEQLDELWSRRLSEMMELGDPGG